MTTGSERRRGAILALVAALAAVAPAVQAQPLEAGDVDDARAHMSAGHAKYDAGDYRGALPQYQAADRIMAVPTTRAAVGRTLEKLGRLVEARTAMQSVARMSRAPDEPQPFTAARAEAAAMAAALDTRIPTLTVVAAQPAVAVQIDATAVTAGTGVPVDPGRHTIVAEAPGFQRSEQTVDVAEGEQRSITVELVPLGGPPGPQPPPEPEAGSGSAAGPVLVGVGFGLAGAGLVLGAVTGGLAAAAKSDLDDRCPDGRCPRSTTEDDYDAALSLAHASTAGFVVAGVGAALGIAGIVIMVGDSGDGEAVAMRVGPGIIGMEGRF